MCLLFCRCWEQMCLMSSVKWRGFAEGTSLISSSIRTCRVHHLRELQRGVKKKPQDIDSFAFFLNCRPCRILNCLSFLQRNVPSLAQQGHPTESFSDVGGFIWTLASRWREGVVGTLIKEQRGRGRRSVCVALPCDGLEMRMDLLSRDEGSWQTSWPLLWPWVVTPEDSEACGLQDRTSHCCSDCPFKVIIFFFEQDGRKKICF